MKEKYINELKFQKEWVRKFSNNKDKIHNYWKKYRDLEIIIKKCHISKNKNILDIGCGISTVLHFIEGKKYAIDPLVNEYKKIYRYPSDISIIKSDGEDLPFKNNYFDVVFCSNAIDHTTNPNKILSEIKRVVKKNGFIIITVEIFNKEKRRDIAHPHTYTEASIKELLNNNFSIIHSKKSPWIGLYRYASNITTHSNYEQITVLINEK